MLCFLLADVSQSLNLQSIGFPSLVDIGFLGLAEVSPNSSPKMELC